MAARRHESLRRRREEHEKRVAAYQALTPAEKLKTLPKGGAKKQRRLLTILTEGKS